MSDRTFRLAPSDIDQAFERNEFRVVFQPKVELATQHVTGAEVFIRWQHPTYGLLPPGLFLDFIEAQGRMSQLTGFVFHESLKAAARWRSMGRDWAVSVNVGPRDLVSEGFADGLAALIGEYGLRPEHVIIEVPERALAQDPEALSVALVAVRKTGVQVALDGGGIVPVDLHQFSPMPFTSIKVGGTATIRLAQRLGLKGAGAIAARLRFARQYGLEAVAVGAEDEVMMKGLEYVGFTAAQGIWVQKPMPLDDLMAWDGTWARGNGAIDIVTPAAAVAPARPAKVVAPAPVSAAVAHATTVKPQAARAPADGNTVSKEDMQRALEAVRARRPTGPAVAEAKPVAHSIAEAKSALAAARKVPVKSPMPQVDLSDLEDVVEDEEVSAPPAFGQQKGDKGEKTEPCPPMKSLVERRKGQDGAQPTTRRAAQDGVF
jgi:EAL domain-containing protein (putative c-di-GMP-specific phosphodiesterase class I)